MWWLPVIAWGTMTPNSNIPCGKLWKFSQFKHHALPGTLSHSVAHKVQALWSYWGDHGAADAWGRSFYYLLYFPHDSMWPMIGVTHYFQTKLPSTIIPSQKHLLLILPTPPPRRTLTSLGSSISSSFPVFRAELFFAYFLKPLHSEWPRKHFDCNDEKIQTKPVCSAWWGCCWELHLLALGEGGEWLLRMQRISGTITALTFLSRGWTFKKFANKLDHLPELEVLWKIRPSTNLAAVFRLLPSHECARGGV